MGWDRHKLLWDGNRTDKYVPWTTLRILFCPVLYRRRILRLERKASAFIAWSVDRDDSLYA